MLDVTSCSVRNFIYSGKYLAEFIRVGNTKLYESLQPSCENHTEMDSEMVNFLAKMVSGSIPKPHFN